MRGLIRLLLTLWLAAFAVQATEALAFVAPDDCVEAAEGPSDDECPEQCPRCICCAVLPLFVPSPKGLPTTIAAGPASAPYTAHLVTAVSRGILHIPKSL